MPPVPGHYCAGDCVGSDTGSRGSSPLDFAEKTGFLLTFLHVELTTMQTSQNFDHFLFAHLKGEFNPSFSGIFWDKLGQIRESKILLRWKRT